MKRIARGQYSVFVCNYSRGIDTGFGLGIAGFTAPRLEFETFKHPIDFIFGLTVKVKSLSFRGCGRWGHLSLTDIRVCPLGYGEDPAYSRFFASSSASRIVL